jgi:hypothetical protein
MQLARKVGWATTWRPGPTVDAARALCGAARWRTRRWQGLGLEHHDYAVDASGKKSGGRAHRGGRASVGQSRGSARWRAAASSPEGGSAVAPTSFGSCRGGCGR